MGRKFCCDAIERSARNSKILRSCILQVPAGEWVRMEFLSHHLVGKHLFEGLPFSDE